jgi:hypothetical protein
MSLTCASPPRMTTWKVKTVVITKSKRQDGPSATSALRRPPRGNKTRSGTSSKEVARRFAAAGRVEPGIGSSRDSRRNSARLNLED